MERKPQTIGNFLSAAVGQLQAYGISSARLDTLIILEDTLGIDRARLLAHPEITISEAELAQLNTAITRRQAHEPLAYIRGKVDFYGRTFTVNSSTLTPRPESESMIDLLRTQLLSVKPKIADIGTGTGCLGITAGLEVSGSEIFLYDISAQTLDVATANAKIHKVRVHVALQDLLVNDVHNYDAIMANLPYVPTGYPINKAARHEPSAALFAGKDGLDDYRRLWQQIASKDRKPLYVITESLLDQHNQLEAIAAQSGYRLSETQGLAQCFILLD